MPSFDPSLLDRFHVLGLPKSLPGDPPAEFRRLVLLKHFENDKSAAVIAPIAHTQPYLSDPDLKRGCVYYQARVVPGYTGDVVIEPRKSHLHILSYPELEIAEQRREFKDFGSLPEGFPVLFKNAVEHNSILNRKEKEAWLGLIS